MYIPSQQKGVGFVAAKKNPEAERLRLEAMKNFDIENRKGAVLAGVDEAGRGPLAGPVFAAAVILDDDVIIEGIDDSKKLSEKKREELFNEICNKARAFSVFSVDEKRIDEINILQATFEAMRGAVEGLSLEPDYVFVDGNRSPGIEILHETVVKGDSKSMAVAAASVLAKVSRDRYITEIAKTYPGYGFEKHKGYGTKAHYEAIEKLGICPIHRKTFLKKILG